jgi:lipopolysaccharide/colanic/teichoic acid biosynthesis glycosyltransferase
VAGVLLSAVLLVTWRIMYSEIISAALPTERILFLGYVPEVAEVSEEIRSQPVLGMSVIGYLSDQPIAGVPAGIKYLGDFDQIGHILDTRRPSRMIVASADLRLPRLQECLFALHQRQTAIERFGSFYEQVLRRVCTSELRPSAVIIDRELDTQPRKLALQSVYTNLVAFVGAAVIFPIMIAIAAAIRATSRMPAIEGLRRMGRNGLPFTLYQFRCHDTHGRRTRIGLWLRRHSLHKLPQLLNILRGEMALIGPPPERPEFSDILSRYMPYVGQRRSVRPGLIGLSQLYCDGSIKPVDEITRIEYDFYYIKHISLSMDVYIILASIRVALGVFATAEAKE